MTTEQITAAFANAPKSYRESTEFPDALVYGDSIFKNLSLDNLQVTSEDTANNTTNFSGTLDIASAADLNPLKELLDLTGNLAVQGSVDSSDPSTPEIELSSDLTNTSLSFMHLNLEAQSIKLFTHYPEDDTVELAQSKASLQCNTTINQNTQTPISFDLVATMTELQENWEFEFVAEEGQGVSIGSGLNALTAVAGVTVDLTLPSPLNTFLTNLQLQAFTINLNPLTTTPEINYLLFEVGLSETWNLIPNVFAIENPALGILILLPETPDPSVVPYVKGTFILGGGHLDVEAEFLSGVNVVAQLREGEEISLGVAVSSFTSLDNLPDTKITQLSINADDTGYLLFDGSLEDVWEISLGRDKSITVDNLSLNLERTVAGTVPSYTGSFLGTISISDMELDLSASYDQEQGWFFEGNTGQAKPLEIGELITYLGEKFGVDSNQIPDVINDISLEVLHISFGTQSRNFKFTCEATIPLEETTSEDEVQEEIDITIDIDLTRNIGATPSQNSYDVNFTGQIIVYLDAEDPDDILEFNIRFDKTEGSKTFVATYNHSGSRKLILKEIVNQIAPSLGSLIPEGIEIDINSALFAMSKQSTTTTTTAISTSKFLFGLNFEAGIDLADLPLVGDQIPKDQTIGIENLQILVASKVFHTQDVTTLNSLFPENVTQLPSPVTTDNPSASTSSTEQVAFNKGLNITADLNFGTYSTPLSLPISSDTSDTQDAQAALAPTSAPTGDATSASDTAAWFKIQKSLGPFHFEKVGVQYKDAYLWFLLDAALSVGPMALSLNGLAVGTTLKELSPDYELNGLGLAYSSKNIEISGAFLRSTKEHNGVTYDEYQGLATIKAKLKGKDLALSAIGSYAYYNGQPSLFLYAVLEFPIGGPAFFFVEGLAGGFGYNRWLTVPPVEELGEFPLVSQVIEGVSSLDTEDKGATLTSQLEQLDKYITPSPGSGFIAIGIKFSSFKLIDSFALLTIAWGDKFELNLIGISSLKIPTPEAGKSITPIAEVRLILRARFAPDEGILSVRAVLDPASYILSQSCRLTGGFAFYSWFAGPHDGDFVITLGGYHPAFRVPPHYPQVPRLGFNWQVDSSISIKGEAYFALCSHAIMAGGRLEARYESGSAKAWFIAGADFLICWKPYHYDISIYIEIGAEYSIFGPLRLGASLHIWGPEFGGTATIDVWLFSFTVRFGDQSSRYPTPIDWNTFKESFLPKEEDVCSISIAKGLVREIKQGEGLSLSVINPKEFALVTNAIIPSKQALLGQGNNPQGTGNANVAFGITPVGIRDNDLETSQKITVKREGNNGDWDIVNNEFTFQPMHKQMPTAMWGQPNVKNNRLLPPDTNDTQFVEHTLSGFQIVPTAAPDPGDTDDIPTKRLQYETVPVNSAYGWQSLTQFSATPGTDSQHQQTIRNSVATNLTRDRLLRNLGFNPEEEVNISNAIADTFLAVPQVK